MAFDSTSTSSQGYGDNLTQSHTIGAGSNRILVVGLEISNVNDRVSGVTFNGIALTRIRADFGNPVSTYLYYLINPPVGTFSIVASLTTNDNAGGCVAASFTGIDQTSPIAAQAGTTIPFPASPSSLAITPVAGATVFDVIGSQSDLNFVVSGGQTYIGMGTNTGTAWAAASYKTAASAMAWTLTPVSQPLSHSAVALAPVAGLDVTPPTLTSAAVANGTPTVVNLTMSEAMDTGNVPAASAFTVTGHTVSSVAITGSTINLTCSAAFVNGEAARTVSYTQPGTANARDVAGNLLANFSTQAITNNVAAVDTTAPTFASAQVTNAAPANIVITMSETLAAFTPSASAFAVSGGKTVSNVARSGSTITLTCSAAYAFGDTITVTYTKPGTNMLQDAAGNQTASFGPSAVTNSIASPGGVTFAQTGQLKNLNGAILPDGAYTVTISSMTSHGSAAVGVKTGQAMLSGRIPLFTVSGPVAGTEYEYKVINEADPLIRGLARATGT